MRRALDAARSRLASLTDRDAILDCFFEHSRHLFTFAAFFVVRGDTAHGRNVYGLGAPDGLVTRLTFPMNEPGLFARARELRRPFVTSASGSPIDERLFGTLGRMMPNGLAVPLVVRDRVVSLLIGDGPSEELSTRAREAGRPPMDLAKEEMLLWAESVSDALERLIKRRKGAGGSVPPPALAGLGSTPPPPLLPSFAPPPRLPVFDALPTTDVAPQELAGSPVAALSASSRLLLGAGGVGALLAIAVVAALLLRGKPDGQRVVIAAKDLAGGPGAVSPKATLDQARKVSGLGERAELASIRAEIGDDGLVDLRPSATNADATLLAYHFVTSDVDVEVRVEADGMHGPHTRPRSACNDDACSAPVVAPTCEFSQIWKASRGAGLGEHEHAFVVYAAARDSGAAPKPEWTVSVAGRGQLRIDAETCQPLRRERLRPAAVALAAVPGAPRDVDPLAVLALARTQSGLEADAVLVELDARGVDRRGLVDLADRESGIVYTFSDPPSEPGKRRWRHVKADANGMAAAAEDDDRATGAAFAGALPTPPRCTMPNAVEYLLLGTSLPSVKARITFGSDVVAPDSGQWSLDVPSASLRKRVSDNECAYWQALRGKPGK